MLWKYHWFFLKLNWWEEGISFLILIENSLISLWNEHYSAIYHLPASILSLNVCLSWTMAWFFFPFICFQKWDDEIEIYTALRNLILIAANFLHLWSLTVFRKMVTYSSTSSLIRTISNNALYNIKRNRNIPLFFHAFWLMQSHHPHR